MKRALLYAFFFLVSVQVFAVIGKGKKQNSPSSPYAHRRAGLHTEGNIRGEGIIASLGGTRGKYFRHVHIAYKSHHPPADIKSVAKACGVPTRLEVHFVANSDSIIDRQDALDKLKELGAFLKKHHDTNVSLTGNTGTAEDDSTAPLGSSSKVLNYPAKLNGQSCLTGELMIARANAIKKILSVNYGIAGGRISTSSGTQFHGVYGRYVGVDVGKQNPAK